MPRESSLKDAISDGFQITLRNSTYDSAVKLQTIRREYPGRVQYWQKFGADLQGNDVSDI